MVLGSCMHVDKAGRAVGVCPSGNPESAAISGGKVWGWCWAAACNYGWTRRGALSTCMLQCYARHEIHLTMLCSPCAWHLCMSSVILNALDPFPQLISNDRPVGLCSARQVLAYRSC